MNSRIQKAPHSPVGRPSSRARRTARAAVGLIAVVVSAPVLWSCKGPSNPEPVLGNPEIDTGRVSLVEQMPDMVLLSGVEEAIRYANRLQVVNLDRGLVFETDVLPDGSFGISLEGLEFERYRLMALDTSTRRYDTAVVTGDPNTEGVIDIPVEAQGCLYVGPTHLDLGQTAPGDPLYGELTVTNDCDVPMVVLDVMVDNPRFTPVTILTDGPMPPRSQGVIGVVFVSQAGPPELGVLTVMIESMEPDNLPLLATLHAVAAP